jgi:hypothetical protein
VGAAAGAGDARGACWELEVGFRRGDVDEPARHPINPTTATAATRPVAVRVNRCMEHEA